jgi:hypothetical protein
MFKIDGTTFDGYLNYRAGSSCADIEAKIIGGVDDETLGRLKDATLLEDLLVEYGEVKKVRGTYQLFGWRRIENAEDGLIISWQTYRTTDIEQMKRDNEDLTQAILELAAIVGGDGNG